MKKFFVAALLASLSVLSFAEGKIAVVNLQEALFNTDVAQQRREQLETDVDFKKSVDEVKDIQEQGRTLLEKLQKDGQLMAPAERQQIEAKVKGKQADMEHLARKIQEAQQGLMQGLMLEMNDGMQKSIQELIQSEGIGLLLMANPQIVLHADTSFDITAKLTDKLNKQFKPKKK
ncbi:Uncharacterised protein [BD1-7 clade bacterium]|uniref:Chaperone protein Skp n=1 Tax=BD1-7 clade bacterium TaxID=2029982 RepID=A0A5S9QLR0_9GAMM|nr:Uncharacterised protein [BD1-7 clade bacterium]CAA0115653.1 Uncharacterised protein [BD1-7 clade bacterium]CAA0119357.1 Uncharacterised protein [BD1-7 clade bacterium]